MSGQQYLSALSENASRLGARLQETLSERTRELTLARTGAGGDGIIGDLDNTTSTKNIRKHLESGSDREKLDAMKRLVALLSKNRNVSEHFPHVVKLVAHPSLEIRKLVYIYLLRYAEHEPDLALLSINTFQRDLADASPLIRGMALRVLSGIKVQMVGSLVVLAIKRAAGDGSGYVRKGAALAVPRCYNLDPQTHLPSLLPILTTLLADRSPLPLGAVVLAFEHIAPTRLDLIHPHFRRYCRVLVEMDEWGQVGMMGLLGRYVRVMIAQPVVVEGGEEGEVDKDLKLLLDSVKPIFQSRNPAVVMAAAKVYFYTAPPSYWPTFVQPLLRLLTVSKEVERVVLVDLLIITRKVPRLFAPYYTRFLVRSDDLVQVKKNKIRLLLNVLNTDNYAAIMREFIDYADDVDDTVVGEAILALGRCATRIPECMPQCLTALITMIKSRYDIVVSNAVMVLKHLVQKQLSTPTPTSFGSTSQSPLSIIAHIARRIDDIKHAQARACVIWLVGQYAASDERGPGPEGIAEWAPDVLRKLAKTFASAAPLVKLQTITLAAKLFVLSPYDRTVGLLARYVFSQARYDVNYDVRDRGRMVVGLLVGVGDGLNMGGSEPEEKGGVVLRREQVRLVLFEGKTGMVDDVPGHLDDEKVLLGSLAGVTGKPMQMDEVLPDWLERGVESSLRDSEYDAPAAPPVVTALSSAKMKINLKNQPDVLLTPTSVSTPDSKTGKGAFTDLDAFYADKEESEEEEEEEEEEEGSGEEEEEESGDEEDGVSGSESEDADDITHPAS